MRVLHDYLIPEIRGQSHHKRRRSNVRRAAALGVALAVIAVAVSPAFGLGGRLLALLEGGPLLPGTSLEQAGAVAQLDTSWGRRATLWVAPTESGGRCVFLQWSAAGETPPAPEANGAGQCELGAPQPQPGPLELSLTASPLGQGRFGVLLSGRVAPAGSIARLVLSSPAGERPLALRSGYFLAELGVAPSASALPGPATLVGYAADGSQVAQVDLERFLEMAEPKVSRRTLSLQAASPRGTSRALASCYPDALVPLVYPNRTGFGRGNVTCDPGAPTWQYTARLVNRAGNILASKMGGPISGSLSVFTDTVSCAGAIVHSFLYINVGGQGKSDTSGETSC